MARYGRDYGIRLVDRDLLKDTRWALDRPENPGIQTHRGPPGNPPTTMRPAFGYDVGLRGPRGEHPGRGHGFERPTEMPYDGGFRGNHPPADAFGIGPHY